MNYEFLGNSGVLVLGVVIGLLWGAYAATPSGKKGKK